MIIYVLLGLAVGSFLNVCIDRLPRRTSLIRPPSSCDACGRRLGVLDLLPVISYLVLRGRCRYCGAPIPLRVMVVELLTGITFGILWWWLGPGAKLVVASLYAALFVVIAAIDLEFHLVLNRVIYPAILIGPLAAVVYGVPVESSLIGAITGFLLLLVLHLIAPAGMGAGDVKLAAFLGEITGFPGVFVALFAASVVGGVVAALLLLSGIKSRKDPIPFAPFLVFGAAFGLTVGKAVTDWYLGLF